MRHFLALAVTGIALAFAASPTAATAGLTLVATNASCKVVPMATAQPYDVLPASGACQQLSAVAPGIYARLTGCAAGAGGIATLELFSDAGCAQASSLVRQTIDYPGQCVPAGAKGWYVAPAFVTSPCAALLPNGPCTAANPAPGTTNFGGNCAIFGPSCGFAYPYQWSSNPSESFGVCYNQTAGQRACFPGGTTYNGTFPVSSVCNSDDTCFNLAGRGVCCAGHGVPSAADAAVCTSRCSESSIPYCGYSNQNCQLCNSFCDLYGDWPTEPVCFDSSVDYCCCSMGYERFSLCPLATSRCTLSAPVLNGSVLPPTCCPKDQWPDTRSAGCSSECAVAPLDECANRLRQSGQCNKCGNGCFNPREKQCCQAATPYYCPLDKTCHFNAAGTIAECV